MFRKILIAVVCILCLIVLFVSVSILPVERTDYHLQNYYHVMMKRLDSLKEKKVQPPLENFSVGYATVNLTPEKPTATAGYGKRRGKVYTSVHDSVYIRTMVITNGTNKVAIVSADLLIIPPTVTDLLEKSLPDIGFTLDNTYLGAIHSHNSIGNWGKGVAGLLYGSYDDSIVHFIAERIKLSIIMANANVLPAAIKTAHIPLRELVKNRLIDNGPVDSLLHVVEVKRNDSSKLVLMSYTAHATCLFSRDLELSRDYPGELVDKLEGSGYDFAMFMAGAVGSHKCKSPESGWLCIDWMADAIVNKFETEKSSLQSVQDSTLNMYRVPLALPQPQVKITKYWRVRPWLFNAAFGESQSYLTALRIGELVMLGTPCDYSGELTTKLYASAKQKGLQVMVTSFNGDYIGYITPAKYYDTAHYETQLMNWYGQGSGEYIEECLDKLLTTVDQ